MNVDRVTQSLERHGRFVRGEYLELGGRVQSWVLAGERGAVEIRGTSPARLYILVHSPVQRWLYGLHSQHVLVDAEVLNDECQVLEGRCSVFLIVEDEAHRMLGRPGRQLSDPWAELESFYDCYLGQEE